MVDDREITTLRRSAVISLRFLLVAAALVVIVYGLVRLSAVVLPVLIALLIAALLEPPARWLRRRRVPGPLASAIVLLGSALVVIGLLASIVPAVAAEANELGRSLTAGVRTITSFLVETLGIPPGQIRMAIDQGLARLQGSVGGIVSQVLTGASIFANALAQTILTLIVAFFFVNDGERIWNGLVGTLRQRLRGDAHALGARGYTVLKAYVRGVIVVAVVDSVLIGLALWLIETPLMLPLVVITFLGAFFPLIGAVISGAVAVLVALVLQGPGSAALVLLAVIAVQQIEGNVLYPFLVGGSLNLHPLLILLALAGGTALAGVVGALLAVPVAAVASGSFSYLRHREGEGRAPPPDGGALAT